jgi:hypothetical protein
MSNDATFVIPLLTLFSGDGLVETDMYTASLEYAKHCPCLGYNLTYCTNTIRHAPREALELSVRVAVGISYRTNRVDQRLRIITPYIRLQCSVTSASGNRSWDPEMNCSDKRSSRLQPLSRAKGGAAANLVVD